MKAAEDYCSEAMARYEREPLEEKGGLSLDQIVTEAIQSAQEDCAAERCHRERLPDTRKSLTRKFNIRGAEGVSRIYATVGTYEDGRLGEIFIKVDKQGSLVSGAIDAVATMMSVALQYGVPLEALTGKLRGMRFPPEGLTGDKEFPSASSILDLVARWLESKFVGTSSCTPIT